MRLVERKTSYAEPDRAANVYILDRVLGRPRQALEVTGKDGESVLIVVYLPSNGRDGGSSD